MSETPLEMEERHIALFEALITKQELLLAELERDGRTEAAGRVRDRLASIAELLRVAWERHGQLLQPKL